MKHLIPKRLKIAYHLSRRQARDRVNGDAGRFAKGLRRKTHYQGMVETRQPVRATTLAQNKIHNIRLASAPIANLQLLSGEILSFWKAVGPPSASRGYLPGRNLLQGQLREDIGGGLCQLSGIMYHTALKAGLEIRERHPHSVDIYQEHERYTPLGADAAVAYPYKDLRLQNPYPFPVQFSFLVNNDEVVCRIFLEDSPPAIQVEFLREEVGGVTWVSTQVTPSRGEAVEVSACAYQKY